MQVGATRDGLDPYLDAARRRGLSALLIETPDYLRWREVLGRRAFDQTIAVEHPSDPPTLISAIKGKPRLILAGFERYTAAAHVAAQALGACPAGQSPDFTAPYKRAQRTAVAAAGLGVHQPRHVLLDSLANLPRAAAGLNFPVVVKPGDGGGGLGVLLVNQPDGLAHAGRLLQEITNYDGGRFEGWLVEEYIKGVEISVQGVAQAGEARILTFCEKLITIEPEGDSLVSSFRESGHIAYPAGEADAVLQQFTQRCLTAVGFCHGPFHVDLISDGRSLQLLEMGFRLSGMRVTELVTLVSGLDWAEEAFRVHLGEPASHPKPPTGFRYAGHLTMRHPGELESAKSLPPGSDEYSIAVQSFTVPALPPPWDQQLPPSLSSDIGRHAGAVGRVVVQASRPQLVAQILERCRTGMPMPAA